MLRHLVLIVSLMVMSQCAGGYYYDRSVVDELNKMNSDYRASLRKCPEGQTYYAYNDSYHGSSGQCRPTCREGFRPDMMQDNVNLCIPLCHSTEGKKWDSGTKSCVSVCKAGFTWQHDKCHEICPAAQQYVETTNSCECEQGKVFSSEYKLCLSVQELIDLKKADYSRPAKCLQSEIFNGKSLMCESRCKDPSTKWSTSRELCEPRCPGATWDTKKAECRCRGKMIWNELNEECEDEPKCYHLGPSEDLRGGFRPTGRIQGLEKREDN